MSPSHSGFTASAQLDRRDHTPYLFYLLLPVGVMIAVGAFLGDKPEFVILIFLGAIIYVGAGLRLELLMAGMLANVLMGSARFFENSLLNLNRLLGVAILLGLLLKVFLLGMGRLRVNRISWTVFAYAIAVFLSVIFAEHQGIAAGQFRRYIRLFLLFFLITNLVSSRRWLRFYLITMVGAGSILVVISAMTSYNQYAERTGGVLNISDFNYYGCLVATLVPIAIWGIRYEPHRAFRLMHLVGLLFLSMGVYQSKSRGALLALLVAGVVMTITREISRKVVVPVIVVGALALPIVGGEMIERFSAIGEVVIKGGRNLSQDAQNVMNRLNYIRAGIPMFLTHPITGVGIEGFGWQYPVYVPRDAKERSHRAPHNTYLQCITETGILGTLPFIFLLFWTFQGSWRLNLLTRRELSDGLPNPRGDPLIASLSLYLIFALTTFCVAATFITAMTMDILWVIFGIASVLPALHAERFPDDNAPTRA